MFVQVTIINKLSIYLSTICYQYWAQRCSYLGATSLIVWAVRWCTQLGSTSLATFGSYDVMPCNLSVYTITQKIMVQLT